MHPDADSPNSARPGQRRQPPSAYPQDLLQTGLSGIGHALPLRARLGRSGA